MNRLIGTVIGCVIAGALSGQTVRAADADLPSLYEQKIAKPWFMDNGFTTDFEEAQRLARESQRPIFAYFTASYFVCAGCIKTETGLFASKEFADWSKDVVLFACVATNIPGKADDAMAWRKGAMAFPWLAMMDAHGHVTAYIELGADRDAAALEKLRARHNDYLGLAARPDKTTDEQVALLTHDIMNGNVDFDTSMQRIASLEHATDEQRGALETAAITFQFQVYQWNTNPDRSHHREALTHRAVDWFKADRQPPAYASLRKTYLDLILRHAEEVGNATLFGDALDALGDGLGDRYLGYVERQREILADL